MLSRYRLYTVKLRTCVMKIDTEIYVDIDNVVYYTISCR